MTKIQLLKALYFPADVADTKIIMSNSLSSRRKQKRKKCKKQSGGLARINQSAYNKATSTELRRSTNAHVAREIKIFEAKIRKEEVQRLKRKQIKEERIRKYRQDSQLFIELEDKNREKVIIRSQKLKSKHFQEGKENKMLKRICNDNGGSVIVRYESYLYTKDRTNIAIEQLSKVLEQEKENHYINCQEHLLLCIKQILLKQSLPLKGMVKIFCKAYSNVHRFDAAVTATMYPHVFLNLFSSKRAKKSLFEHLITIFSNDEEKQILFMEEDKDKVKGNEKDKVQKYILDVLCGLTSLQCVDVHKFMEWYNCNNPLMKPIKQQLAKDRCILFVEWYENHKGDGPRQLKEKASIEIISSRMRNYYSRFETLDTNTKRGIYQEILKIVASINDGGNKQSNVKGGVKKKLKKKFKSHYEFYGKSKTVGRIFAGAWCNVYMKNNGVKMKEAIERYDSLFVSIFKNHCNLEHILVNMILISISKISFDITEDRQDDDPLIICLKSLYNIYAIDGKHIIKWYKSNTGEHEDFIGLINNDQEINLKKRMHLFVEFLIKEQNKERTRNGDNIDDNLQIKKEMKLEKDRNKLNRIQNFMNPSLVPSIQNRQPLIPNSMKRAPNLIENDLRGGKKQWGMSNIYRPQTPLFGCLWTDPSKPQYPKKVNIIINNHPVSKSTVHRHTSPRRKQLLVHYHDNNGYKIPLPPKIKESNQRKHLNFHRKLIEKHIEPKK
jgi:hypothetical protein